MRARCEGWWTWRCSRRRRRRICAASSIWPMDGPATTLLSEAILVRDRGELPKGSRLFRRLDPDQFRAVFQRFMARFSGQCHGVIAIRACPGKVARLFRSGYELAAAAKPAADAGRGRIETRTATAATGIAWLRKDHQWPGLAAIGKIVRIREPPAKTTAGTAYYLLSAALSPSA